MAVLAETRATSASRSTSRRCARPARATRPPSRACTRSRTSKGKKHKAYRLVLYAGAYGEYYGVQGLTWRYPPILDDPDGTRTVNGRKLMLYYDGSHLRLVAWRTQRAVYWVTNTLSHVDPEQPPDRDRRLAAAAQVVAACRS